MPAQIACVLAISRLPAPARSSPPAIYRVSGRFRGLHHTEISAKMNLNRAVGTGGSRTSLGRARASSNCREMKGMIYAILAYHVETEVMSWTREADAALMDRLTKAHQTVNEDGRLGPAARLGFTGKARTLRGPGQGLVIDGPFAE